MRSLLPGVFVLVLAAAAAAGAATPSPAVLVPGTYVQVNPVTRAPLEVGSQLVIIAGKGGRLGFSINAIRALDSNQGFVAGVLAGALPSTWSQRVGSGNCRLRFDAVPGGGVKVTQDLAFGDCGFGYGVTADGTYAVVVRKAPKT
jgi:hypothetical protein